MRPSAPPLELGPGGRRVLRVGAFGGPPEGTFSTRAAPATPAALGRKPNAPSAPHPAGPSVRTASDPTTSDDLQAVRGVQPVGTGQAAQGDCGGQAAHTNSCQQTKQCSEQEHWLSGLVASSATSTHPCRISPRTTGQS
eukprot:351281-Chlamydomonas_euryale.AAC.5